MKEAGLEIKTAHCLRVTTATNLFRAGHQEKLIRERTGHVSSALFTYEKPSNDHVKQWLYPSVLAHLYQRLCRLLTATACLLTIVCVLLLV
jgi:integrase